MSFKPGDKVRCITNDPLHWEIAVGIGPSNLVVGRVYTVMGAGTPYLHDSRDRPTIVLKEEPGPWGFFEDRFELVPPEKVETKVEEELGEPMPLLPVKVRVKA